MDSSTHSIEVSCQSLSNDGLLCETNILEGILAISAAAITVVDTHGRITFANDAAEKILGIKKSLIIERTYDSPEWNITDFEGNPFPNADLPFVRVMTTGEAVFEVQHAITVGSGERRYLSINGSPLKNSCGVTTQALFSIVDITEHVHNTIARRRVEDALQLQLKQDQFLEHIAHILRRSPDLLVVLQATVNQIQQFLGADRVVIYRAAAPNQAESVLVEACLPHYPSLLNSELPDLTFIQQQLIPSDQPVQPQVVNDIVTSNFEPAYVQWLNTTHVKSQLIIPMIHTRDELLSNHRLLSQGIYKDHVGNELAHVSSVVTPPLHVWGLLIVHHCASTHPWQDWEITLLQRLATQLAVMFHQTDLYQKIQQLHLDLETQVRQRTIQKLNQLKDDFLNTTSHELRTPLSSIKTSAQLMRLYLEQLGQPIHPKIERCLTILQEECDREINLINSLLLLQHINARTHPIIPSKLDLKEWLPQIIETFDEKFQDHQQTCWVDIAANLPLIVTDLFMFNYVMNELLTNAHKFTPAGETIAIAASSLLKPNLEVVIQISVTNTGVDISANDLSHVFDQFYRVPSNDPWKHGGTGIGLMLVKKLVEYLGGAIAATSHSGQTCFTFELPLQPIQAD